MKPEPRAVVPPLILLAAALWSSLNLGLRWQASWSGLDSTQSALLIVRCGLTLLAYAAWIRLLRGRSKDPFSNVEIALGLAALPLAIIVSGLAELALLTDAAPWNAKTPFFCALLASLICWSLWLVQRKPGDPLGRSARVYQIAIGNAVASLVVLELLLSVLSLTGASLFVTPSDAAGEIARRRPEPETPYFGMPLNEGGYHDRAFFRANQDDLVVALIGDSFGYGMVPHDRLFKSIAEEQLREAARGRFARVAIHNFSITGIGPQGYLWLLEKEVLDTHPRTVVVAIFVGNDISQSYREGPGLARLYTLSAWRSWEFARRVTRLVREAKETGRTLGANLLVPPDAGDLAYLDDTSLERPTFSQAAFLRIESRRVEITRESNPRTRKALSLFAEILDSFHARLGERLMLLIIPDEFQVDDVLFAQLMKEKSDPSLYDQFWPQREIRRYCEALAILCVDPLATLRAAQLHDRVYQRRDTHWNSRGNRIAGQLLGAALVEELLADGNGPSDPRATTRAPEPN